MTQDQFEFEAWLGRIARRWKSYVLNMVVAGGVMYGITYLMPTWFRATSVLLPPEESDELAGIPLQRFLSRVPSFTGVTHYYTPSDVYRAVLESRTVQQTVAERFDLKSLYHKKSMEKTLREFHQHVKTVLAPDGTIAIAVEDRSRQRAADLANALVEELDRFNVERRNSQAKRSRLFLQGRVGETDSLLRVAESGLRSYQEVHHVVAPPDVESSSLAPMADAMARKMDLEVRLAVLRSYLAEDNEQVVQVRTELDQLKQSLGRLPRVETELGRLMRDYKLYQQLYVLLSAQLEDARLRETMDTPTLTVLDAAVPPERRARPIRWLWTFGAMGLAFLAGLMWFERPASRLGRQVGSAG